MKRKFFKIMKEQVGEDNIQVAQVMQEKYLKMMVEMEVRYYLKN